MPKIHHCDNFNSKGYQTSHRNLKLFYYIQMYSELLYYIAIKSIKETMSHDTKAAVLIA